jgi:hypothetical protein
MIPGILISMGGKDWTVPPLTLGQLRRLGPKIREMTTIDARGLKDEQIDAMSEIVATALARNYPKLTAEAVLDLLDMGNARPVLDAVLAGSGLRRSTPGEARAVGNGVGVTSMDSSPPPADTATQ